MRAGRGVRWCAVAAVVCVASACSSGGSSKPVPHATRAPSQSTTSTTTLPPLPNGFPRYVVVDVQSPSTNDQRTVIAIDLRTGKQIPLVTPANPPPGLNDHPWSARLIDVSPDGRTVAVGANTIPLDTVSNQPPTQLGGVYLAPIDGSGPLRPIQSLGATSFWPYRFSPDGRWLVGAGPGTKWTVWPVDGGTPVRAPSDSPYNPDGVAWSPDGTRIAIAPYDEGRTGNAARRTYVFRFDATHHTLTRDVASTASGTAPWFTVDGVMHTVTGPINCNLPQDVDASHRWGVGVDCTGRVTWWSTASGPERAQPLPISVQGPVIDVSW